MTVVTLLFFFVGATCQFVTSIKDSIIIPFVAKPKLSFAQSTTGYLFRDNLYLADTVSISAVHCLHSDSASPKPGSRRSATLMVFVTIQCC